MQNPILCVKRVVLFTIAVFIAIAPFHVHAVSIIRTSYDMVPSDLAETVIKYENGTVISRRTGFFERSEMNRITNARSTVFYADRNRVTEELVEQKYLGGLYFIFLDNFCESPYRSMGLGRYISAVTGDDNLFLGISEIDETSVLNNLNFRQAFSYRGINFTFEYSFPNYNGHNHPYYSQVDGILEIDKRIDKYKELLSGKVRGIPRYWLYSDRGIVVVMQYGTPVTLGAMFGIWESDRGEKFGYKRGDTLYMSEKYHTLRDKGLIIPNNSIADEYGIKFSSTGVGVAYERDRNYGYGDMTWSKIEVLADRERIYPYLAWRRLGRDGNPINSQSQWEKNRDGAPRPDRNGNIPPNAPDSDSNTNPPVLRDCPDMDWYFELFTECLKQKMNGGSVSEINTGMFNSYSDYLGIKMMETPYDPTIYGKDGRHGAQAVDVDNMPVQPRIYKRIGGQMELMNESQVERLPNPFHPSTQFTLRTVDTDWWNPADHISTACAKKGNYSVDGRIMRAFESVFALYDAINGSIDLLNELDRIKQTTARREHILDIDIVDDKYKQELLYIGNPFNANEPYTDKKSFCVLDKNYKDTGKPFKLHSEIHTPYLQYGSETSESPHRSRFNWYITWTWNIVFVDKSYDGLKRVVGTITYRKMFWENENENIIQSGATGNWLCDQGTTWNTHLRMVNTTDALREGDYEFVDYDINSKDYYTDSKDVSKRDSEIDKGEAMRELILKIAVAEGLNLGMKTLYYIGTKTTWGKAAYEGAKRIEASMTRNKTYQIAQRIYEGYIFWQKTTDVLADARDNYNAMIKT